MLIILHIVDFPIYFRKPYNPMIALLGFTKYTSYYITIRISATTINNYSKIFIRITTEIAYSKYSSKIITILNYIIYKTSNYF